MTTPEGTITFFAKHQHRDWFSNQETYRFGAVSHGGVTVEAVKQADRTYTVSVDGLPHGPVRFVHPVPKCDSRGLFTAITWTVKRVTLYLNGREVDHQDIDVQ